MAGNHLEDLIAEWYQFLGYFVIRNKPVGRRKKGGYECELDIVAFHPVEKRLVQIEPSMDTDSWEKREERYAKKFAAGTRYIPDLFKGLDIPTKIEQHAVFFFGSKKNHKTLAGGKVYLVNDIIIEIFQTIKHHKLSSNAIPEHLPTLRTLQYVVQHWGDISTVMNKAK